MNYDLLLHVDAESPEILRLALNNAANYRNALPGVDFRMVLVGNGPAVKLFTRENAELAARGAELMARGLAVRLCANAMGTFGVTEDRLWPDCEITAAGILEIVRLQREGFAYVKP